MSASQRLITFAELNAQKGIAYSRDHLRRLTKSGLFPAPKAVSSARIAWVEADVDEWLKALPTAPSAN